MPRRRRRASLVRRAAALLLSVPVALVALASAWLVVAELARQVRESKSPQQIAAGKGRWVAAGDATLYVQEWGKPEDPALLLTHGTGAWSGTWFGTPAALQRAGWRVIAVDLPPFGLSTAAGAPADYTRAAQAGRLIALVDHLGVPVTLVGHSFGAGPALEAAMHAGDRVRQLVLVDPALGLGADGSAPACAPSAAVDALAAQRGVRSSLVAASATWPGLTATMLKRFVHRQDAVTDELVPAYQVPFERYGFTASLGDWAVAFAGSACEAAASLQPRSIGAWAAGPVPVALVWGEADTITPIAQAHALQAWMPKASLAVIPGVGHIPHIEDPGAFAKQLLAVLLRPAAASR